MRHNPSAVKTFAESLPAAYRAGFDWAAIAEHTKLAAGRRPGHPAIGSFYASRLPGQALCIIADDRPGLLALISSALIDERLDVIAAEAYTRLLPDQTREAVDLFWVQRLSPGDASAPLTGELILHLERTLDELLKGSEPPRSTRLPTQRPPAVPGAVVETTVRFIEDRNGTLSTLEVEAGDRAGLLLVLSKALYEQQVQIVSSSIRSMNGRVKDRFEVTELDDTPIRPDRRLLVQVAVLSAIQESFGQK